MGEDVVSDDGQDSLLTSQEKRFVARVIQCYGGPFRPEGVRVDGGPGTGPHPHTRCRSLHPQFVRVYFAQDITSYSGKITRPTLMGEEAEREHQYVHASNFRCPTKKPMVSQALALTWSADNKGAKDPDSRAYTVAPRRHVRAF